MEIIRQVEEQIGRGELSNALSSLKGFSEGNSYFKSELLKIEAELSLIQKDFGFGVCSHNEITIARRQVICSIVEIAAKIEYQIRSPIEESKIYLYKAQTQSWLKDSYIKQRNLEKLKISHKESTEAIKQHNEYLESRIEKLNKINKRLNIVIGVGFLTSIAFNLYIINLINDFITWDRSNSAFENSEISLIVENALELNEGYHASNQAVVDDATSNDDKELFKNAKTNELKPSDAFLKGPKSGIDLLQNDNLSGFGLTQNDNLIGSIDDQKPIEESDSEFDFDNNI